MSKIQKYDIIGECYSIEENGSDYIKVSELEKLYQEEYAKLDKELSWKVNSYSRAEVLAKKELLEHLLAALDSKEGE